MSDPCPNCGKPVPPSALDGLCPECMLQLGAAAHTEAPGETGPQGTRVVPPPKPEEIARHFPQLEILECLGRGGMGVVYKARQPRLDRLIALKILAPEKEQQPQFAERFTREAKALARLNHPNIVTVYDFGEADGFYYLLMEYVDGMTLRQLLQGRKLAPEEALIIVPKICEALQFAHEQGVVHRDIKPENVLLDKQGRVKIADFGIAKIVGGRDASPRRPVQSERTAGPAVPTNSLTQDQVVGTPHYMAPEQVERPQLVDHRADIYSLGVVFYEMLTGELPLGKFQPPSRKVQVDVRLDEVVLHALEKEPERRYQRASDVKTALETIAASPGTQAQPAANPVRILRWRDLWLWDTGNVVAMAMVPMMISFALTGMLWPFWGKRALLCLLLWGLGLGFAATYGFVGAKVRRLKAALPRTTGEVAEALMFRRPFQSPGLAVLHPDRLEMTWVTGAAITVPLEDIPAVAEVRWFNGTRLWWKKGFVLELANGQRVGVAVPEPFARRWRARLSRGTLPEIPADSGSVESRPKTAARQQVQAPAAAMLIAVVLNYLLLVSLSASLVTGMPRLPFALVAGAITALVVVGAVQMWRGKAYALAVVASILMMIMPPACILGLPLGIWALVVLRRREVRELFGRSCPLSPPESPPPSRGGRAWNVAVAAFAAVLLVLAIPVGALLLKVGIVSFHKAGKPGQAIAATQNSPPATAPAVSAGPVVEQGLSSAATQRPIKAEDLDAPSSAAQPGQVLVSPAEPGTFKITLTNGVSVEVVAVVRNPLRNKSWWKPDGTPLPQPPGARVIFQPTGMWKERDVDEEAHAMLVRCDLPTGAADRHWQYGLEHRPRGERLGSLQIQQGNRMEQAAEELERLGRKIVGGAGGPKFSSQVVGYAEVVRFPAGTEEVALQCRSAVGPWEPVAVFDGKQTKAAIEGVRVLCTYLRQEPNGKCLDVTHDVDRGLYALRMMGVFKGGRREELAFHSGVLSGRETQGFVLLEPGQRVENIVEFVLERTAWVNGRIEGIRLDPKAPSATME